MLYRYGIGRVKKSTKLKEEAQTIAIVDRIADSVIEVAKKGDQKQDEKRQRLKKSPKEVQILQRKRIK